MSRDAPAVDAVLFDFGGVLAGNVLGMMADRVAKFGLTRDQFLPIALGPLDRDTDHPWHRAERGELSLAQFTAAVEPMWRAAGFTEFPAPPTTDEMRAAIRPIPEMVEVARAARAAGYRTGIVSNMIRDWSDWRDTVDADELVDLVVDSSQVGLRKPASAIYLLAVDRLGVAAERALFLDDFVWNVEGARAAGLQAMHVVDPVAAATELRALLGLE